MNSVVVGGRTNKLHVGLYNVINQTTIQDTNTQNCEIV